jgi:hypothetical protein
VTNVPKRENLKQLSDASLLILTMQPKEKALFSRLNAIKLGQPKTQCVCHAHEYCYSAEHGQKKIYSIKSRIFFPAQRPRRNTSFQPHYNRECSLWSITHEKHGFILAWIQPFMPSTARGS